MKWNDIVCDELNKKHVGDAKAKEVVFLCALGRLVKNRKPYSFNVLALSGSSAGKDHLMTSILKIFPKDDYETYGRISRTALNYLHTLDAEPLYSYNGKILLLKEISDEVLNNEIMKEFTSGEDEISRVAITRQRGAGVDVKEISGHPCVFVTTATTIPSEEIRNRFSIVKLDESEEQTRITRRKYGEGIYNQWIIKEISELKPQEVVITDEMFDFIDKHFPVNKLRYRRDFQKFLDWVRAVAVFHQNERMGTTETIRAEWEDFNIARDVYMNAQSRLSDLPLKKEDKKIIEYLEMADEPKSVKEIHNSIAMAMGLRNLYNHIYDLKNIGILESFELKDDFGNTVSKYALSEEYKQDNAVILPPFDGIVALEPLK